MESTLDALDHSWLTQPLEEVSEPGASRRPNRRRRPSSSKSPILGAPAPVIQLPAPVEPPVVPVVPPEPPARAAGGER